MKRTILALAALVLALPLSSCATDNSTEAALEVCEKLPRDVDLAVSAIARQGGGQAVIKDHINILLDDVEATGYEDLDEAVSYVRANASNFTQKEATIALNNISTVCESLVDEAATPEPESTQEEEIAEAISPLDEAFKQCDSPRGARVTDEGETLIIHTTGDDTDVRASFADVTCILRELEAPSRTLHRMETTRSLDASRTLGMTTRPSGPIIRTTG